jgi:hypothetical protein
VFSQPIGESKKNISRLTVSDVFSPIPEPFSVFSSDEAKQPFSTFSPDRLWRVAETMGLFPSGFPSINQQGRVGALCEAIESHPMKAQFVDLILSEINRMPLITRGTHEPPNWDDGLIVGFGGIAGRLIDCVATIAEKDDCPRIVASILSTNDAAKIAWFRRMVEVAPQRATFEALLAPGATLPPPPPASLPNTAPPPAPPPEAKVPAKPAPSAAPSAPSSSSPWLLVTLAALAVAAGLAFKLRRR